QDEVGGVEVLDSDFLETARATGLGATPVKVGKELEIVERIPTAMAQRLLLGFPAVHLSDTGDRTQRRIVAVVRQGFAVTIYAILEQTLVRPKQRRAQVQ